MLLSGAASAAPKNSESMVSNIHSNMHTQTTNSVNTQLEAKVSSHVDLMVAIEIDKELSTTNNHYDLQGGIILNGDATLSGLDADVNIVNSQIFSGLNSAKINSGSLAVGMDRGVSGNFNSSTAAATAIANSLNVSVGNFTGRFSGAGGPLLLSETMLNHGSKQSLLVLNQQNNSGQNYATLLINKLPNHGAYGQSEIEGATGSFNSSSMAATAIGNSVNVLVGNISIARTLCSGC